MVFKKGALFFLLFCVLSRGICFAEARYVSPERLADSSDQIVIGSVVKVDQSREEEPGPGSLKVPVRYAEVAVEDVFKGRSANKIRIRFAYHKAREADVQDPNLKEGERALFYLSAVKGGGDLFRVVNRWSGRCRIIQGKLYHQYDVHDERVYLKALKDYLK
jgi:hypothetical protein